MPKKPTKTKQETTVENFFPLEADDVKRTIEKQVKAPPPKEEILKRTVERMEKEYIPRMDILDRAIEKKSHEPDRKSLETIESSPIKKKPRYGKRKPKKPATKKPKKNTRKSTTKQVKYSPPKVLLKKDGYELIITEKPQAALKIASSLGASIKRENSKVPYYELTRDNKKIIVACAVGHLFTLKQNVQGSNIPIFDISWVPNYIARKQDFTKRYYDTILKLARNASSITIATDFDVEGEVIGMNVMRFLCGQKDAQRMKFSTLTKDELNKSYDNKLPTIQWGQAIAGETRHYLDWFYGINLSRALMNSIKTTGKFRIMSIGRVQGPSLKLIVDREREIEKFEPEPYWQVYITGEDKKNQLELKHSKDIFNEEELEKFKNLKGKKAEANTKKREQVLRPQPPFNLTTLQTEAYKLHGITPSNALKSAQSLYLAGLISYPRTSSQKLPKEIGYDKILRKMARKYNATSLIKRKTPIEGSKTDPAHPSIYPTGQEGGILSGNDEKIYNLIARRFIALFCEDAILDNKTITATVDKLDFSTRGSVIRRKGWMKIYPSKQKEERIPDMSGSVDIIDQRIEKKETQPPRRYSPASILSELEKRNLGTKATRAAILETLYDRGYVQDQSITATPLGISLITTLEKYSPIIIDEELTRDFEKDIENIGGSKQKDLEKEEEKIINKAKDKITEISKDFEKSEIQIGKDLLNANLKQREAEKIENKLIQCPKCKKGDLAMTYSKKNRSFFIACDSYPDCKNTYSLPPGRKIKKTDQDCKHCDYPTLMALKMGKKPWIFCFNPECTSNKKWKKKREDFKKKQEEK